MSNSIHVQIIAADRMVCDEMVNYIEAPLENGNYGILSKHAPMIASLTEGVLRYRTDEKEEYLSVMGGILSVENDEVRILTHCAEYGENIDIVRAENSVKRAKDRLASHKSDIDRKRAEASLNRSIARQRAYLKSHSK